MRKEGEWEEESKSWFGSKSFFHPTSSHSLSLFFSLTNIPTCKHTYIHTYIHTKYSLIFLLFICACLQYEVYYIIHYIIYLSTNVNFIGLWVRMVVCMCTEKRLMNENSCYDSQSFVQDPVAIAHCGISENFHKISHSLLQTKAMLPIGLRNIWVPHFHTPYSNQPIQVSTISCCCIQHQSVN